MIRTQVYLPEETYNHIRLIAKSEKKVVAYVIRDLLERGIKNKQRKKSLGNALLELSKLGIAGPKDLSTNHDDIYKEV